MNGGMLNELSIHVRDLNKLLVGRVPSTSRPIWNEMEWLGLGRYETKVLLS